VEPRGHQKDWIRRSWEGSTTRALEPGSRVRCLAAVNVSDVEHHGLCTVTLDRLQHRDPGTIMIVVPTLEDDVHALDGRCDYRLIVPTTVVLGD